MNNHKNFLFYFSIGVFIIVFCGLNMVDEYVIDESRLVSHIVDLKQQDLKFYWKDANGENYLNLGCLKEDLSKNGQQLVFGMNGGMYLKDHSPQGLFIENGQTLSKLNTKTNNYGNFYLQPNGVFYLTKDHKGVVCSTQSFEPSEDILYANQSGPMLLIDGQIHSKFTKGSKNLHIRNGVGVLPNGSLLFAMSKKRINFYDFASYFKQHGCKNALYLDGFVSKTYLPSKEWEQLDGNLGVLIGEVQ